MVPQNNNNIKNHSSAITIADIIIIKNFGPVAVAQACNPSTLEGRGGWITRSRDRDHPGIHGEAPAPLKIQKLAGHVGTFLYSQLLRRLRQENCLTQEAEVAVSRDGTIALQPGQQSETSSKKKEQEKNPAQ